MRTFQKRSAEEIAVQQRRALELRRQGMSHAEVADELGMAISAVRTAKSRALRQYLPTIIHELLEEMGEDAAWFQSLR